MLFVHAMNKGLILDDHESSERRSDSDRLLKVSADQQELAMT
jgi:hypothetical protein